MDGRENKKGKGLHKERQSAKREKVVKLNLI